MRNLWARTAAYAVCHFLVDFSCAYLLFSTLAGRMGGAEQLLVYNFCAFALQMPLGLLADRLNRNAALAGLGLLLTSAAFLLRGLPMAVCAGVGNALFHLGGGLDVLNDSQERCAPLGVFVSPGALGLYFGSLLRADAGPGAWPAAALLAAGLALPFLCGRARTGFRSGNAPWPSAWPAGGIALSGLCLFSVVVLRSLVGMGLDLPWRSAAGLGLALTLCTALGKAAGGFLADRLGAWRASLFSLGAAALLFLFSDWPLPGLAAVLAFNMTMPITLWALAKALPQLKGFGFGTLTFALFLGFLPSYLGAGGLGPWALAGVALLSLGLLWLGLGRRAGA